MSLVNESRIKGGVYSEYVVFLVGTGMLFGKAVGTVVLHKEMLIAEFHVLSNIPNLFETMA